MATTFKFKNRDYEGVRWEGHRTQIEEIQHMLFDFDVRIAEHLGRLLIIAPPGEPQVVNLDDVVVFDPKLRRYTILRSTEDHHQDGANDETIKTAAQSETKPNQPRQAH